MSQVDTQDPSLDECPSSDTKLNGASSAKRARRVTNKYSTSRFTSLSPSITGCILNRIKFDFMKHFQAQALPELLDGTDLVGYPDKASGKRLAYCIQLVELIKRYKYAKEPGTKAIIIIADRDSAIKTFNELRPLLTDDDGTIGLLVGGVDKDEEVAMLQGGVTIIIAVPGFLLGHIRNTKKFVFKHLKYLVIDDADKLLKIGFGEDLSQILAKLPKRQTALFCYNTGDRFEVEQLAKKATSELKLVFLDPLVEGSSQSPSLLDIIFATSEMRCKMLHTFMRNEKDSRMVILFASEEQIEFYNSVLAMDDHTILRLYKNIDNYERGVIIDSFRRLSNVSLFATLDQVEDLNMFEVDWFVQFDPPHDLGDFIRRCGRPAADLRDKGRALLFLRPEEVNVLLLLKEANFVTMELQMIDEGDPEFQTNLNALVEEETMLGESARRALKDYFRYYNSIVQNQVYDSKSLDMSLVAKSYGFVNPAGQIFV